MSKLNKFTVEELQAEIESRAKKFRIDVQGVEFNLNLEEIKELQAALNKISDPTGEVIGGEVPSYNPPPDPMEEYRKMMEKRQNDQTPWQERPLIWPDKYPAPPQNPWKTAPYNPPPIWCGVGDFYQKIWTT